MIGATSQQYPLLMASMGIEAIKAFADSGKKPEAAPGQNFFNTGVTLITDKPASRHRVHRHQGRARQVLGLI